MRLRGTRNQLGLIVAVALAMAGTMVGAHAEKRIALVIGNGAYQKVQALENPGNDAADMAQSLQRLGFSVSTVFNGTFDSMRRGILEFNRKARGADIAVVFFAGHGIEVGGENWMIPVDAELRSDIDVDHEAIGLKSILPSVESAAKLGLVILDACRNNPFAAKMQRTIRTRAVSRGLAGIEPSGNVLVAYAAKDGTTAADGSGRNSPFTTSLLKHIETPGLEINFLFRNVRDEVIQATRREQQPFVYGSLSKEAIYLKAPLPVPVVAAPPPGPAPDEVTFALIKETSDISPLRRFIAQFPDSPLRRQAEERIAALTLDAQKKAAAPPPGPAADVVAWNFLRETNDAAALRRFMEQYPRSAHRGDAERRLAIITTEQAAAARALEQRMAALAAQAEAAAKAAQPAGPPPEEVAWSLVKDSSDANQFRLFLERFPKSPRRAEAERRMAAVAAAQRTAAQALEQRLAALTLDAEKAKAVAPAGPPDRREIARSIQLELKRVGCFEGAVNGDFDPPTRTALRTFARLAAVTVPDDATPEALNAVRGIDKRVCPLVCKAGERVEGEHCVKIVCPSGQLLKDGTCVARPAAEPRKRVETAPRARPSSPPTAASGGKKCFSFEGRRFCE